MFEKLEGILEMWESFERILRELWRHFWGISNELWFNFDESYLYKFEGIFEKKNRSNFQRKFGKFPKITWEISEEYLKISSER